MSSPDPQAVKKAALLRATGFRPIDPYAGIRTLDFKEMPVQLERQIVGLQSDNEIWDDVDVSKDEEGRNKFQLDWNSDVLKPYQSKYNHVQRLSDDVARVTLQQQRKHKYDTLDAYYRLDPESGKYTLVGDPQKTRQVSSAERVKDSLEKGVGFVGTGLALGYVGGQALAGAQIGGSALASTAIKSAAVSGGLTAAQGGSGKDILRAALLGGISAGAGSAVNASLSGGALGKFAGAATSGAINAAASGASGGDILRNVAISGASGLAGAGAAKLTDSNILGSAVASGTSTALRGGSSSDVLRSAAVGAIPGAVGSSGASQPVQAALATGLRALLSKKRPEERQLLMQMLLASGKASMTKGS